MKEIEKNYVKHAVMLFYRGNYNMYYVETPRG